MRKMDLFGFYPITEETTQGAATIACELAHEFSCSASNYGDGVKSITATLILTDPNCLGAQHQEKRPKFNPGLRRIAAFGTVVELEDELEFSIRPEFTTVNGVSSRSIIANAIASALMDVHSQLESVDIAQFDMRRFLSEIETFFASVGQSGEGVAKGTSMR
jgi:shikimate kinase